MSDNEGEDFNNSCMLAVPASVWAAQHPEDPRAVAYHAMLEKLKRDAHTRRRAKVVARRAAKRKAMNINSPS